MFVGKPVFVTSFCQLTREWMNYILNVLTYQASDAPLPLSSLTKDVLEFWHPTFSTCCPSLSDRYGTLPLSVWLLLLWIYFNLFLTRLSLNKRTRGKQGTGFIIIKFNSDHDVCLIKITLCVPAWLRWSNLWFNPHKEAEMLLSNVGFLNLVITVLRPLCSN